MQKKFPHFPAKRKEGQKNKNREQTAQTKLYSQKQIQNKPPSKTNAKRRV